MSLGSVRIASAVAVTLLLALCAGSWLVLDPPSHHGVLRPNPSWLEAQSLRSGTLELPDRLHDTALHDGRIHNVFQPGQTLVFLAHDLVDDELVEMLPYEVFALFVLTMLLLHSALLRLTDGRRILSFALTVSMMFGAPYVVNLPHAFEGSPWRLNQVVSVCFLVAALRALITDRSARSMATTGLFVGAAMLFRAQSVLMVALPLLLVLKERRDRVRSLGALVAFPLVAAAVIMAFQYARFGSPFETGYGWIYAGRDDELARRAAEHGLVSWRFLGENLWRTFLAIPWPRFEEGAYAGLALDDRGNSLLFSQPVLLLGLFAWRVRRSAGVAAYVVAGAVLSLPVLLHHNPGWYAPGYMRLALDYLPLWIAATAVVVARTDLRWTVWAAVGGAVFAVAYAWMLL